MQAANSPTMQHVFFKGIYLVVHGNDSPRDEEWKNYTSSMNERAKDIRGNLVFTIGAGPNAAQRKATADMWLSHGKMPPTSIVTPSTMVRGIVTALNWLVNGALTAFSPSQFQAAVEKVGVAKQDYEALCAELSAMAEQIGLVKRFAVNADGRCIVSEGTEQATVAH